MADNESEKDTSNKKITFGDTLKLIAAFGIIIPLLLGYFEYRRSVQQSIDNNFRDLVEKLSSEKKENRLAGATNLGTFISNREDYYSEAADILINSVAIERNINVLNAIRGSLGKIEAKDYKKVLQQLLNLDRNSFIYEYPLETLNLQEELNELRVQQILVANFIASFLDLTKNNPVDSLVFYQNSLNRVRLVDLSLAKSTIQNSAFAFSNIDNTDLSNSIIVNTIFTYSRLNRCNLINCRIESSLFDQVLALRNSSFQGSIFDDVFFTGSDLTGADFTGATGLKPVYFFKADNIDKAVFDEEFRKELDNLKYMKETEFISYVENSRLTRERINELLKSLSEVNARTNP